MKLVPSDSTNRISTRATIPLRLKFIGGVFASLLLLLCYLFALIFLTGPQTTEPWEEFLSQRILGANQTAHEVVNFVKPRLPVFRMALTAEAWENQSAELRQAILERIVYRGDAVRWRDSACRVEWLETERGGSAYHLRKLRFEALPGMWIPAILYEPDHLSGSVPVVLNFNGHEPLGKAATHTQIRCINLAKRGILALNVEWFGEGQLSQTSFAHRRMNQLDLCGSSGLAPFYLAMKRSLDLLLAHPNADVKRVAVTGLSGGGWQTIMLGALDPRVTLINPVAGYSAFESRLQSWSELGDSEQTPADMATIADYTHLTALLAPRPALLTYNIKDRVFQPHATFPPLFAAARPAYAMFGKSDFIQQHINAFPGTHNYEKDNRETFYRFLAAHFSQPGDNWPLYEIESTDEIKTVAELEVAMPTNNVTFNSLALDIFRQLPEPPIPPVDTNLRQEWLHNQRTNLCQQVAYRPLEVSERLVRETTGKGWNARAWRLQLGEDWQVPVIEIVPKQADATAIVFADEGRSSTVQTIRSLLRNNVRVLAVDPFSFGECHIMNHGYKFSLMIDTVGERSLGIQSGQLVGLANWAGKMWPEPVGLITIGPRSSSIGLIAVAIEPASVNSLELRDEYDSLSIVLKQNISYEDAPELFCVGLLATHDLPLIRQMIPANVIRRR